MPEIGGEAAKPQPKEVIYVGTGKPERPVISVVGVKAKERRVYDLSTMAMDRNRDIVKSMFREFYQEKYRQYYDRMLEAAQTPFSRDSILEAEKKAYFRYSYELASMDPAHKFARKAADAIIDHGFGTTRMQQYAIEEMRNLRSDALQREKAMWDKEKAAFAYRFDLAFDDNDEIVRRSMGERMLQLRNTDDIAGGIKTLVKRYRDGEYRTKEDLERGLSRFMETNVRAKHPDLFKDAEDYATSLYDVASEMRTRKEHSESLATLDAELDLMEVRLGIGQMGEATEMTPTETSRVVGSVRKFADMLERKDIVHQVVFNDAAVGTAVSAVLALKFLPQAVFRMPARIVLGAAGGSLVTAVMSANREYGRKNRMMRQIWAADERGAAGEGGNGWYDRFRVKPRSTGDLIASMTKPVCDAEGRFDDTASFADIKASLAHLVDARARYEVSSREKNRIGLIRIGSVGNQEASRTELLVSMRKTERFLSDYMAAHAGEPDVAPVLGKRTPGELIRMLTDFQVRALTDGSAALAARRDPALFALSLNRLSPFQPETAILRRRLGWFGRERTRGKAIGLDAVLDEFRSQAKRESARYGLKSGAIGFGVGLVFNELAVDIGKIAAGEQVQPGEGIRRMIQEISVRPVQAAEAVPVHTEYPANGTPEEYIRHLLETPGEHPLTEHNRLLLETLRDPAGKNEEEYTRAIESWEGNTPIYPYLETVNTKLMFIRWVLRHDDTDTIPYSLPPDSNGDGQRGLIRILDTVYDEKMRPYKGNDALCIDYARQLVSRFGIHPGMDAGENKLTLPMVQVALTPSAWGTGHMFNAVYTGGDTAGFADHGNWSFLEPQTDTMISPAETWTWGVDGGIMQLSMPNDTVFGGRSMTQMFGYLRGADDSWEYITRDQYGLLTTLDWATYMIDSSPQKVVGNTFNFGNFDRNDFAPLLHAVSSGYLRKDLLVGVIRAGKFAPDVDPEELLRQLG